MADAAEPADPLRVPGIQGPEHTGRGQKPGGEYIGRLFDGILFPGRISVQPYALPSMTQDDMPQLMGSSEALPLPGAAAADAVVKRE